jgi:hypothetical protein
LRKEKRKCSQCKKVYYCNETCQRANWGTHKEKCKKPEGLVMSTKNVNFILKQVMINDEINIIIDNINAGRVSSHHGYSSSEGFILISLCSINESFEVQGHVCIVEPWSRFLEDCDVGMVRPGDGVPDIPLFPSARDEMVNVKAQSCIPSLIMCILPNGNPYPIYAGATKQPKSEK